MAARPARSPGGSVRPSDPRAGEPPGSRDRLLGAALRLFADQGYAKTSIRQIAGAAGVNMALVSYYFGNKAGLYRAAFFGTGGGALPDTELSGMSLGALFEHLLAPLRTGDAARSMIKLYRREMLEPSGLWREKVDRGMQPIHAALIGLLCRRLGLAEPDDDIEMLAMLVIGPCVHTLVNCEVVDILSPKVLADDAGLARWRDRLVWSADHLIEAERSRRHAAPEAGAPGARRRPAARKARPRAAGNAA